MEFGYSSLVKNKTYLHNFLWLTEWKINFDLCKWNNNRINRFEIAIENIHLSKNSVSQLHKILMTFSFCSFMVKHNSLYSLQKHHKLLRRGIGWE
jgi:hypothetical protein